MLSMDYVASQRFFVVLTHTHEIAGFKLALHGYLAVDFFFVLSGFIVAHAYSERIAAGLPLRDFIRIRLIRLHPLIVLGVALGLLASSITRHPPANDLAVAALAGLLTLPVLHLQSVGFGMWPINPPTWSLFWEYAANLAFFLFLVRMRPLWLWVIVGLSFLALCVATSRYGSIELGFLPEHAWGGPARVGASFVLGMLSYRLWSAGRLPRVTIPMPILALFLSAALAGRWVGFFDVFTVAFVFPAIIILGASSSDEGRFWKFAGRLSYPLYIIHQPILIIASIFAPPGFGVIGAVAAVATAIAAATVALLCYDEPIRRFLASYDLSKQHPRT